MTYALAVIGNYVLCCLDNGDKLFIAALNWKVREKAKATHARSCGTQVILLQESQLRLLRRPNGTYKSTRGLYYDAGATMAVPEAY